MTATNDLPACAHTQIMQVALDQPLWRCRDCTLVLIPVDEAQSVAEDLGQRITDATVNMAAAMLWNFHERAVEKYGDHVADAIDPQAGPSMYEFVPEECPEHKFTNGCCINCGASMFLGRDTSGQ